MFTIEWYDFYTNDFHSEIVDGYNHVRRMAAELRQLGVKYITIRGNND